MSQFLVVLGTSHRLQGAKKGRSNIDDPSYSDLVGQIISEELIDFVFEEGTGLGPTAAEGVALSLLGQGHYLDVDPPSADRYKHGISADTGKTRPIAPCDPQRPKDVACWEFVEEHEKRESLWLVRIKGAVFCRALMICGCAHMLSFAFRVRSVGFGARAVSYIPHHKLS